jgi:hypothetical protein
MPKAARRPRGRALSKTSARLVAAAPPDPQRERVVASVPATIQSQLRVSEAMLGNLHSENTRDGYTGQVRRYSEFCASKGLPDVKTVTPETPLYIRAYISFKCESEGLSYSTAEQIMYGLKSYFKRVMNLSNGWCSENASGNPCDDSELNDYLKSLRKDDHRNRPVNQSRPWLEKEMRCASKYLLCNSAQAALSFSPLECKYYLALIRLCFCCWFRIDECLTLRIGDIVFDQTSEGISFISLTVKFRKTNQDNREDANVYQLYSIEGEEFADARAALCEYLDALRASDIAFGPDDLLFPWIIGTELEKLKVMSQKKINDVIGLVVKHSGIESLRGRDGTYTSHAFRRGGAQYRFFYAKYRWPLEAIRWWGGWARGERLGAIVRYLLEEYTKQELDFGDMMAPNRRDRNFSVLDRGLQSDAFRPLSASETKELVREVVHDALLHAGSGGLAAAGVGTDRIITGSNMVENEATTGVSNLLLLPRIVCAIPKAEGWRDYYNQWKYGDPAIGLVPLKDWDKTMRNPEGMDAKRLNAYKAKYAQRKCVGAEAIRLGLAGFETKYKDHVNRGLVGLMKAIRDANKNANANNDLNGSQEPNESAE